MIAHKGRKTVVVDGAGEYVVGALVQSDDPQNGEVYRLTRVVRCACDRTGDDLYGVSHCDAGGCKGNEIHLGRVCEGWHVVREVE